MRQFPQPVALGQAGDDRLGDGGRGDDDPPAEAAGEEDEPADGGDVLRLEQVDLVQEQVRGRRPERGQQVSSTPGVGRRHEVVDRGDHDRPLERPAGPYRVACRRDRALDDLGQGAPLADQGAQPAEVVLVILAAVTLGLLVQDRDVGHALDRDGRLETALGGPGRLLQGLGRRLAVGQAAAGQDGDLVLAEPEVGPVLAPGLVGERPEPERRREAVPLTRRVGLRRGRGGEDDRRAAGLAVPVAAEIQPKKPRPGWSPTKEAVLAPAAACQANRGADGTPAGSASSRGSSSCATNGYSRPYRRQALAALCAARATPSRWTTRGSAGRRRPSPSQVLARHDAGSKSACGRDFSAEATWSPSISARRP